MRADHDERRYDLSVAGRYVDRWERRGGGEFKISERTVVHDQIRTDDVRVWPGPDCDVPKPFYAGPTMPAGNVVFGRPAPEDISCGVLAGAPAESGGVSA
jgi:hypothetical protein